MILVSLENVKKMCFGWLHDYLPQRLKSMLYFEIFLLTSLAPSGPLCPKIFQKTLILAFEANSPTIARLRYMVKNSDYFLNYISYSKSFDVNLKLLLVI